jgi:hypothetical protein
MLRGGQRDREVERVRGKSIFPYFPLKIRTSLQRAYRWGGWDLMFRCVGGPASQSRWVGGEKKKKKKMGAQGPGLTKHSA